MSRSESQKDPAYFSNIVLAALVLAPSMDLTDPKNYRRLSKKVGQFYGQKSRFPEMMKVIKARILASEKIHGPKSDQLLADYTFQANCYFSKGKYRKAIEAGQKSLEIMENPAALTALGNSYALLVQCDKAIEKYAQALEMYRSRGDRANMSVSHCNLGNCYKNKGDYNTALSKYVLSLVIDRELYGDNHPSTARSVSNMASCYLDLGEYNLALEKYEESLGIFKAFYVATPKQPDIARSLCCIGQVLGKLGQYPEAVERLQESLDMRKRIHSGPHNDTAQSLFHLGEVNFLQGECSKAQQKYEVALQMFRTVYQNGHTDIDWCEARLREVKEKMRTEFSRIQKRVLPLLTEPPNLVIRV